jgi:hypothetical protein
MSNSVNVVGSIFGAKKAGSAAADTIGDITGANAAKDAAARQAQQQQDALDKLNRELAAQSQVTPLPTPNSDEVLAARRRSIAAQISRRGRASTILTQQGGGDTLGV